MAIQNKNKLNSEFDRTKVILLYFFYFYECNHYSHFSLIFIHTLFTPNQLYSNILLLIIKSACASMDRVSAYRAKGWDSTSTGRMYQLGDFLRASLFTPFLGKRVWFIRIFQEKENPSPGACVVRLHSLVFLLFLHFRSKNFK